MGISSAKEITVPQEKQLNEQRTALKAFLGKTLVLLQTVARVQLHITVQHHSLLEQ